MKHLSLLLLALSSSFLSVAQESTNTKILSQVKNELIQTDKTNDQLLSPSGFNVFMQRKALSYLTGISDLSLAKYYATYSPDEATNRVTLGFNIPVTDEDNSLSLVINPILEADVKSNFSALYKDDAWKNNIRAGLKLTYLIGKSTLNFWGKETKNYRKNDFKIVRKKAYDALEKKLKEEEATTKGIQDLSNDLVTPSVVDDLSERQIRKKEKKAFEEVGVAEADYLDKEKAYTWYQTGWISAWGLFPLTEADKYTSINNTTAFEKTKFKLWEINLQYTHLIDNSKVGSFYLSPWIKYFQNNSANADLMTNVDYGQYSQFPGADPVNLALLETNKAYIGTFKEFITTNFNLQLVYIAPLPNVLFRPGLSVRYEKNWGDYSPTNWRFGLPIAIQGKEKPVNIELQYRRNDVGNYAAKADFKVKESFGISFGLPFSLLYK